MRDSLWVIPALLTLFAVALAQGLVWLDHQLWDTARVSDVPFIFTGGVDGARGVLSSVSGSLITVTGTVFSLTIVALQLAAGQMTPRILRDFTGDRLVQTVLGILVATFTYTILVLRVIRSEDSQNTSFVPSIATTVAIVLALICVGALILFIHHVSRLIQVNVVIARTATQNLALLGRPAKLPTGAVAGDGPSPRRPPGALRQTVTADRSGYVLAVDRETLFGLCRDHHANIETHPSPGEFVLDRAPLAEVWPGSDGPEEDAIERTVRQAIVIGDEPTGQADIGFAMRQIVDIALRAISPGINDPTTAMICIDRLGQLLAQAGRRPAAPTSLRAASGPGTLVLASEPGFGTLVQFAFMQIRHYGAEDTLLMAHAIQTLASIMDVVPTMSHEPLRQEIRRYVATSHRSAAPEDRQVIDEAAGRLERDSAQVVPVGPASVPPGDHDPSA